MTMKGRLAAHRQIELENHEHLLSWQMMQGYEAMTVQEVRQWLDEKDRAMEWDDQFGFLCELLDKKLAEAI